MLRAHTTTGDVHALLQRGAEDHQERHQRHDCGRVRLLVNADNTSRQEGTPLKSDKKTGSEKKKVTLIIVAFTYDTHLHHTLWDLKKKNMQTQRVLTALSEKKIKKKT